MDLLYSFISGAVVCLVISVCVILANSCTKFNSKDDKLPPFKVRMKWVGWFTLFAFTCPISVPIGLIVLIIRKIVKKRTKARRETVTEPDKKAE